MANLHLVTGYAGQEHVTAADQGAFNVNLLGSDEFVLGTGEEFSASIIKNNQIRVLDGEIYMQGRYIRLNPDTYVDLTIENGEQSKQRHDLIVARYSKNESTGIETANLVVIKGTSAAGDPPDPAYTTGLITNGETQNDLPLYRVTIDELTITELEPLFTARYITLNNKQDDTVLLPAGTIDDLDYIPFFDASAFGNRKTLWGSIKAGLSTLFAGSAHEHAATDITSGVLSVKRGGTGVESLSGLAEALNGAQVVSGSYVGTGTYGADAPNTLTFSFAPKLVIMLGYKDTYSSWNPCFGGGETQQDGYSKITVMTAAAITASFKQNAGFRNYSYPGTSNISYGKKSEDGKTFTWYNAYGAHNQFNTSGYTYHYLAIG